jgi:hypothetical protein
MAAKTDPAIGAFAITPHNTNPLTKPTRCVFVGGAGNLKVTMMDGSEVTFTGILAGSFVPIQCRIVQATGTTATNLVGMY